MSFERLPATWSALSLPGEEAAGYEKSAFAEAAGGRVLSPIKPGNQDHLNLPINHCLP